MKDKRGLTQETIIIIVLTIISFGIIAFVINSYAEVIPQATSKEVCKTSAFARATYLGQSKAFKLLFTSEPTLKCKTDYSCLSTGGACPAGYDSRNVKNADEIRKDVANEMYDCFDQMGGGKIDFAGTSLISENICVICSQIRFSENAKSEIKAIDNFNQYLSSTKIPLQNSTYAAKFGTILTSTENRLDLSKEYAIIYKIQTRSYWKNALTSVGLGGTAGILGFKAGAAATVFCGPLCGAAGLIVGTAAGAISGDQLIDYIEKSQGSNTVVQSMHLTEYTAEDIKKYCGEIISIA